MGKTFNFSFRDVASFVALVVLWLAAFRSAAIFNFFGTHLSLWFLPVGVTMAVAMTAPIRLIFAPLVANFLLASEAFCQLIGSEFTSVLDPILHGLRLFLIYAGAGLFLRFKSGIRLPVSNLKDQTKLLGVTFAAACLGAITGVSLHVWMGSFSWQVAGEILLPWAVGDAIGALIALPVLVPLLKKYMAGSKSIGLPKPSMIALQIAVVAIALPIAFYAPDLGPHLGSLTYVILLPPIVFAAFGGLPASSVSIVLVALFTPPASTVFGYDGERIALQFLILITSVAALVIGAAVSDRKVAFKRIQASERRLDQKVKQRTKELKEAYEFQQHLIRSIGHDLRQPVQSMNMMLDGLALQQANSPSHGPLKQAREIGQTASDFIDHVLQYARRDAGKIEVLSNDFALQRVFDEVDKVFGPLAAESKVHLDFAPTDLHLHSDAHMVREALSNLVQNALRLSRAKQKVEIRAQRVADCIEISVEDQVTIGSAQAGQAGFGHEIVRQVADLLGGSFVFAPNRAVLRLPA